jgi:hypothetical protein
MPTGFVASNQWSRSVVAEARTLSSLRMRFGSLLAAGSERLRRTLATCPAEGTNPKSVNEAARSSSSCH